MAYRTAAISMTLSGCQHHSPIASLFQCSFCTVVQTQHMRGPSAITDTFGTFANPARTVSLRILPQLCADSYDTSQKPSMRLVQMA